MKKPSQSNHSQDAKREPSRWLPRLSLTSMLANLESGPFADCSTEKQRPDHSRRNRGEGPMWLPLAVTG